MTSKLTTIDLLAFADEADDRSKQHTDDRPAFYCQGVRDAFRLLAGEYDADSSDGYNEAAMPAELAAISRRYFAEHEPPRGTMAAGWRIRATDPADVGDDGAPLWWGRGGWGREADAATYPYRDGSLPFGGEWTAVAADDPVIDSPSGWSYRASQENGDRVDCYYCGEPLDDDLPIVNDSKGYAYHEGHLPTPPGAWIITDTDDRQVAGPFSTEDEARDEADGQWPDGSVRVAFLADPGAGYPDGSHIDGVGTMATEHTLAASPRYTGKRYA